MTADVFTAFDGRSLEPQDGRPRLVGRSVEDELPPFVGFRKNPLHLISSNERSQNDKDERK